MTSPERSTPPEKTTAEKTGGDAPRWPVEIRLRKAARVLEIEFDDGVHFRLPAEYLRVESPSAEVQGHNPAEKRLVSGRAHVGINAVEPVGNYAVRLLFDDSHDSGIFTWNHLYELGREQAQRWAAYLDALDRAGQSREPADG